MKKTRLVGCLLVSLLAGKTINTFAAIDYWDPGLSHTGQGSGGNGTWNNSDWYNGSADGAWAANDIAYFAGTVGTVTLTSGETANGLTFTTAGYDITGSTLTLAGSPTISTPSGTTTIASIIAGTTGLTYSGSGTLVLSGVNTYTGGTTINGGTVTISAESGLGATSGGITFANSAMLNNTASISDSRSITLNAGGGQVNNVTWGGTITGGGGLVIHKGDSVLSTSATCNIGGLTNAGVRLFLESSGLLTGATIVNSVSGADTIFSGSSITTLANKMSFVSGSILTSRNSAAVNLTGNITFPASGSMIFSDDLDNTLTGPINVSSAVNSWTLTGPMAIQLGATGAGTVGTVSFSNMVAGTGPITVTSPGTAATGTLVLGNSANTYSGGTVISGSKAIVEIFADGDLGASGGGLTFTNGGTLKDGAAISDSRAILLTNSTSSTAGFIALNGFNFTLSGTITGGGGLSVGGADFVLQPTSANIGTFTETANRVFVSSANALGGTSTPATVNVTGGLLIFQSSAPTAPTNAMTFASGTALTARNAGSYTGLTVNTMNNVTFPTAGTMIFNDNGDNSGTEPITVSGTTFANLTGALTIQLGVSGSGAISNTTINAAIGGTGPLTVTAPGSAATLILGGANTFTGGMTINSSTVNLTIGGSGSLGSGSYAGNITDKGTFIYNSSTAQTLSGVISGTGTLTQAGAGTLTLTGANTYTGGTTVTGGILDGNVSGAIPAGVVAVNGGTLQLDTSTSMNSGVILDLAITPANGAVNLNYSGTQNIIALNFGPNSAALGTWGSSTSGADNTNAAFTGNGVLLVTGQNAYWDATSPIDAFPGAGGTGSWDSSTTDWWSSGNSDTTWTANFIAFFEGTAGTVTLNASEIVDGLTFTTAGYILSEGSSSPTLTLGSTTPIINVPAGATTIGCILTGTTGLTENGSGALTLSGTNTYTGVTTIGAGSTLTIGGAGELGSGSYAGNIAINGAALTNATSANQTFSGVISGSGSLTQSGTGTLTLSGVNTYAGGTTISVGTLAFAADTALGNASGGINLSGGAALNNTAAITDSRAITLGSGGGYIGYFNGTTFNGQITGGNNLTIDKGDFILASTANNTIGTLSILSGRLFINTVQSIASVANISIPSGSYLDLQDPGGENPTSPMTFVSGSILTVRQAVGGPLNLTTVAGGGGVTFPASGTMIFNEDTTGNAGANTTNIIVNGDWPTLAGNLTIQLSAGSTVGWVGNVTMNGAISDGGAGDSLTLSAPDTAATNGNALILNGTNGYTGNTIISNGGFTIGGSGCLGVTATATNYFGNITNYGLLTNATSANQTWSGVISGTGTLTQSGAGTLILTNANTYGGKTTISNGTLLVANTSGSATGTSSVIITNPSSGTLTGSGSISGPVVSSGNISATNLSGGCATLITGAETWNAGTSYICALSSSSLADEISVTGTLTINSGVTLDVISLTAGNLQGTMPSSIAGSGFSVPIATATGGIIGAGNLTLNTSGFSANGGLGSGQFSLSVVGNTLYLNFGIPPVPGPFSLGAVVGIPISVPIGKILVLAQDEDANGTLSITSVTTPTANGASVSLNGPMLTYVTTSPATPDTINYTLSDGFATATGSISVLVSPNGPGSNGITITGTPTSANLLFFGIPNTPYYIQTSSPGLTGPWTDINSGNPITSDSQGMITFTVNNPPSPSYYRTSANP